MSSLAKTQTTINKYGGRLRGRYGDITTEIRRGIIEEDIFDLANREQNALFQDVAPDYYDALGNQNYKKCNDLVEQLAGYDPDTLNATAFVFERDRHKHEHFMEWLRTQQEAGVLSVISRNENTYIRKSYTRGLKNADQLLKRHTDVSPEMGVATTFNLPIHQEQVSMLYERNFEALSGITSAVSNDVSRHLADGLQQGQGPNKIGRTIANRVDTIGRNRATTMARTEVMHSHNYAAVNRYSQFDSVDKVRIVTNDPCSLCQNLKAQGPFTLERAMGMLPGETHPNCMCIVVPVAS